MLQFPFAHSTRLQHHPHRESNPIVPNEDPSPHRVAVPHKRLAVLLHAPVRSLRRTLNSQNRSQITNIRHTYAQVVTRPTMGFAKISPSVRLR